MPVRRLWDYDHPWMRWPLTIGALVAAIAVPVTIWSGVNDVFGGVATGEVVHVATDAPGRRVYSVLFVTDSGTTCESTVDSGSNPAARAEPIRVGDRVRVHHAKYSPCRHVREPDTMPPWLAAAVAVALFMISSAMAYEAWRGRKSRLPSPLWDRDY